LPALGKFNLLGEAETRRIPARRNPRTIEDKARPMPNASHQKSLNEYQTTALHEYQTALQWMHEGKYDKARQVFEKLSQDGPVEILERVRVYLAACQRRVQQSGLSFDSPEGTTTTSFPC
jgi:hypothetical protein